MIGFRNEKNEEKMFNFPEPTPLKKTMSDIFGKPCEKKIGYTLRLGGLGSGINDRRNWDSYKVEGKVLRITPEHGKLMQGFPKDFYLASSKTNSMRLLGNSVAVDAIYHVGKSPLVFRL